MGGLDIPVVIIKKPETGAVLSPFPKKIIIIMGRSHPAETPSSFMIEGFLRKFLESKPKEYNQLFSLCEIHIIPMLNPDGVVVGNSRTNLGGVDMNRRWGENIIDGCVTPELNLAKEYIMSLGEKVNIFIDVQGHSMADGLLFYSS